MEYTLGARAASNLRSVLFRKIKICINYSNSMNHYSKFFKSETTLYWIIWKKLTPSLFSLQKYYIHGTKELERYWWCDFNAKLEIASAKGIKEYLLLLSYCSCCEFSLNLIPDTAAFRTTKYPISLRILDSHLNFWFLNFLLS